MAEATHLLGLPRKHKPRDIKPQGAGSGLDADKVDGLHASELGGGGPHASSHETGGGDKVHFADLERNDADATLHDALTSAPHISQAEKDKIHDRLHALDSSLDHSGIITDAQHGDKTTIPNAHHSRNHNLGATDHPDVLIASPSNDEVLTYESATSKWKNKGVNVSSHQVGAVIQSSDVATSSTSFVDIPNISITLTTGANKVLIIFSCTFYLETQSNWANSRLLIDGVVQDAGSSGLGIKGKFGVPAANSDLVCGCLDFATIKTLTAGSHTFKVQWKSDAGQTLSCRAASGYEHMVFAVVELKN